MFVLRSPGPSAAVYDALLGTLTQRLSLALLRNLMHAEKQPGAWLGKTGFTHQYIAAWTPFGLTIVTLMKAVASLHANESIRKLRNRKTLLRQSLIQSLHNAL